MDNSTSNAPPFPAVFSILLLAAFLCAVGCGEAGQQLDVQLDLRLDHDALPAGGPVGLTYVWQVAADAEPVNGDYQVFAHFRGADGEIRWQDDHHPPIPTSQWQQGQVVEYSRILFVPDSVPPGDLTVAAGLYDQGGSEEKVKLTGRQGDAREYETARFEVIPADQLPIIIYGQGWYNQELGSEQGEGGTWRWCRGEAVCWVESPGHPCSLFLEVRAPVKLLGAAQTVTLELEGTVLASLVLSSPDRVIQKIPVPERLMKDRGCVRLVVRTDKVVPPETGNSADSRELGLKFYRLALH